ncbi:MAG: phosphodiester glycosidase family protein [Bacteroidales bacterium]|nr:phosphodiester glycosidase family protein [Bacteroidales bacterium]
MNTKNFGIISFLILFLLVSCKTNKQNQKTQNQIYQLRYINDSLYNSSQRIKVLSLSKKDLNKRYIIDIAYSDTALIKTSTMASRKNALAAINGSFFDMDHGGSVTYFELNDSIISYTRNDSIKWGVPDSIINAALIISKNNKLIMEPVKKEIFYKKSKKEHFVMVAGPLLIHNSKLQSLPNMAFSTKRHPRTCIGITKDSILFITVDGRSETGSGMTLKELQTFVKNFKCTDAINMDGGGSTTIWTKEKGLLNSPSDKKGERSVANAILILPVKNN